MDDATIEMLSELVEPADPAFAFAVEALREDDAEGLLRAIAFAKKPLSALAFIESLESGAG